jgi:hypothetical protein
VSKADKRRRLERLENVGAPSAEGDEYSARLVDRLGRSAGRMAEAGGTWTAYGAAAILAECEARLGGHRDTLTVAQHAAHAALRGEYPPHAASAEHRRRHEASVADSAASVTLRAKMIGLVRDLAAEDVAAGAVTISADGLPPLAGMSEAEVFALVGTRPE